MYDVTLESFGVGDLGYFWDHSSCLVISQQVEAQLGSVEFCCQCHISCRNIDLALSEQFPRMKFL